MSEFRRPLHILRRGGRFGRDLEKKMRFHLEVRAEEKPGGRHDRRKGAVSCGCASSAEDCRFSSAVGVLNGISRKRCGSDLMRTSSSIAGMEILGCAVLCASLVKT